MGVFAHDQRVTTKLNCQTNIKTVEKLNTSWLK